MTTQEAYEAIRAWLARDGATQCYVDGIGCVYAENDDGTGNHCAIGGPMLTGPNPIPYDIEWEEVGIDGIVEIDENVKSFWSGANLSFLRDAQGIHDETSPLDGRDDWQDRVLRELDETAVRYGLKLVEQ